MAKEQIEETNELSDAERFAKFGDDAQIEEEIREPVVETETETVVETEETKEVDEPEPEKETLEATEETEVEGTEEPEQQKGWIPPHKLREEADKRRALETQLAEKGSQFDAVSAQVQQLQQMFLAQQQKQAPQADAEEQPYLDPDTQTALSGVVNHFQEQLTNQNVRQSMAMAKRTYGEEYDAAAKYINEHGTPQDAQRLRGLADPGEEIVKFYRSNRVLTETNGDLDAFRQRTLDDALTDPAFLEKALAAARGAASTTGTDGAPVINLAPSVNRGTRAEPVRGAAVVERSQGERFKSYDDP